MKSITEIRRMIGRSEHSEVLLAMLDHIEALEPSLINEPSEIDYRQPHKFDLDKEVVGRNYKVCKCGASLRIAD